MRISDWSSDVCSSDLLENGEARGDRVEIPFQKISVLKPGQGMVSYLSEFGKLKGKTYEVDISWKRDASSQQRQKNSYTLSMLDHEGVSRLGDEQLVEIEIGRASSRERGCQ